MSNLSTSTAHLPAVPEALRVRHLQLAHQLRHAFGRLGLHDNADATPFTPRVKRIAWTQDGEIALVELDETRLWHIPSSRLTNADTLRKLRRVVGQPIAVLAQDHTGAQIPGIFYVVSYAARVDLPARLQLTLADVAAIQPDRLLVPIGQFKNTTGVAYRSLPQLGHTLLGSATQRGKTSLLHAWIGALAARNTPDRYRVVIIDAKATTLHRWRALPHCDGYATDLESALNLLGKLEAQAADRFAVIRSARVDNWLAFEELQPGKLPAIQIIIDELPDFVLQSGGRDGAFSTQLGILAGKVLGAGMVITIAGTEMSHDVVSRMVQANISTRIGFQMGDRYKSTAVLQSVGAEKLPAIKGRALWRDTDRPNELTETQMVYLDGQDVDTIIAQVSGVHAPQPGAVFVPTVDGVSAPLAADVARWCMSNGTSIRDVWAQFKSRGLSRTAAGKLLNEWAAQGLLGDAASVNEERPLSQKFLALIASL